MCPLSLSTFVSLHVPVIPPFGFLPLFLFMFSMSQRQNLNTFDRTLHYTNDMTTIYTIENVSCRFFVFFKFLPSGSVAFENQPFAKSLSLLPLVSFSMHFLVKITNFILYWSTFNDAFSGRLSRGCRSLDHQCLTPVLLFKKRRRNVN